MSTVIDIATVIVYTVLCIFWGFYRHRKVKNIREYTLGNQDTSTVILTATIFATAMGAGSCIGSISKVYDKGLLYGIPILLSFFYWLFMSKIFSSDMSRFKKCISLSEVMSSLYGEIAGSVSSILIVINSMGLISLQVTAIGHIWHYFSGLSYFIGVLIGMLITVIYSVYAGFRSVALTDLFQFSLFFIALPLACGFMYKNAGNDRTLWDIILSSKSSVITSHDIFFALGSIFYLAFPSIGAPYLQRVLAAKSSIQAITAFRFVAFISFLYSGVIVLMGLILKSSNHNIVPEQGLFYIIDNHIPNGVKGLIVSSVLAVTMSTADSWLNIAGSVVAHDIIKKYVPSLNRNTEVAIARIAVVVVSILAAFFALHNKEFLGKLWLVRNFWHPVIAIPLLAGILGFKTHKSSFMLGFVPGVIFTVIGRILTSEFGVVSLLMGTCANAIFFFGSHYYAVTLSKGWSFKILQFKIDLSNIERKFMRLATSLVDCNIKQHSIKLIGFLLATSIPIFIFWPLSGSLPHDIQIYLRLTCMLTAICLALYQDQLSPSISISCIFLLLIYCFPFFSAYSLCSYGYSWIWVLNLLLSCMCFYFFTNIISCVVFYPLGALAGYIYALSLKGQASVLYNTATAYMSLSAYLCFVNTILIAYFIFIRHIESTKEIKYASAIGSSVAHDLRNPLSLIRSYIFALKFKTTRKSKLYRDLQKIESAIDDTSRVIDHSLVDSKEGAKLNLEVHSIKDIITDTVNLPLFKTKKFSMFKIHVSKNFYANVDRFLLSQVFINLFNNAITAMEKCKEKQIHISAGRAKRTWYVKIRDIGKGITEHDKNEIFNPFFTTKEKGAGIGLAFCKYALNKMGASISCESKLGVYTEFTITFEKSTTYDVI